MKLHDFIENYIGKNTLIKLWKNIDKTSREQIAGPIMEWEILKIPELSDIEFVCITDILCESSKEAVNIVIRTEHSKEYFSKIFKDYENETCNKENLKKW